MSAKKFIPAAWVESQIATGSHRVDALRAVHDRLLADGYRGVLSDAQAFKAAVACQFLISKSESAGA